MQTNIIQTKWYLGLPCALQDVHQSTGHFLFALDTQQRLQNGAQRSVVVGHILCELFIQLHRQDAHGLKARLEPQGGVDDFAPSNTATLGQGAGLNDGVPLLHKLTTSDAGNGNADQAQVCALLLL